MNKPEEDKDLKKYSLNAEEQANMKRLLSTMGFVETIMEGLRISSQVQKVQIEERCGIKEAPVGFKYQSRIDMEKFQLLVKKVKIEEPKKEETKK